MITAQEVHDAIELFCREQRKAGLIMPGYEFAHIVLDDYNLQDGDIHWCISRADEWMAERLKSLKERLAQDGIRQAYMHDVQAVQQYRQKAKDFLNWLLNIPLETRIEAEWLEYGEATPLCIE